MVPAHQNMSQTKGVAFWRVAPSSFPSLFPQRNRDGGIQGVALDAIIRLRHRQLNKKKKIAFV